MKKILKLALFFTIALVMMQCSEDEEIAPVIDDKVQIIDSIKVAGDNSQSFSMDGQKSNVTQSGYNINGGLHVETDTGRFTIYEDATFSVSQDLNGNLNSMQGSGPFQMPDFGFFKSFDFEKAVETSFVYNTGQYFKDNNENFKSLPLRDTSYYFFFNILNIANGNDETLSVKNAQLGVTSWFLNLDQQEMIIPSGKFEINTPEGPISVGDDLAIGLSVKKSFPFTPQQYADSALNAVIQKQQAFENMAGLLYLAGEIGIGSKIVPLKLDGSVVFDINLDLLFSDGFDGSDYSFAMNGNLVFGHALLDLLPLDFEAELTNTTVKFTTEFEGMERKASLKFAGTFDDNKWMETVVDAIAGTNISQYIPFTGNEGNMFMSLGEEWELYVNTYFAINTPHLGKQPTREGTLHITEDELFIQGMLAIPFVPGELTASGRFGYNGDVHLEAKGDKLTIENLQLDANIDFDIYNDKATLVGDVTFPFEIGKINIDGLIDKEGLTFKGSAGNKPIKFGQVSLPVSALKIDANLRKSNPFIKASGFLSLPQLTNPLVSISGTIDSRGVEFIGSLNNNNLQLQRFTGAMNLPFAQGTITARTWQGVYFNGGVTLPFGLASATANGYITSRKDLGGFPEFFMNVNFNSNPTLKIEGFNFPTADFNMTISTLDGMDFKGRVNLGNHFGFVNSSGKISRNQINFTASYNNSLLVGGRYFGSSLKFNAGSNRYPNIASMSGSISTPFGNVKVSGVLGLNGKFACSGEIDGCSTVSNPFRTFSAKYKKKFAFSTNKGIELSATGELCDNNCAEATSCVSKTVSTKIDWQNKSFQVCIPVPLLGDQCF